jgi:hypothetical protein
VAHFVPSRGTFCAFLWHMVFCSPLSRIAKKVFFKRQFGPFFLTA